MRLPECIPHYGVADLRDPAYQWPATNLAASAAEKVKPSQIVPMAAGAIGHESSDSMARMQTMLVSVPIPADRIKTVLPFKPGDKLRERSAA
jgi:hypothetical protein